MRTPPTNWTALMAQPHETETRIDIAGVSYYGYDGNSGIWSCETHPMLFDKLGVGNCCSSTINLTLSLSKAHWWKRYKLGYVEFIETPYLLSFEQEEITLYKHIKVITSQHYSYIAGVDSVTVPASEVLTYFNAGYVFTEEIGSEFRKLIDVFWDEDEEKYFAHFDASLSASDEPFESEYGYVAVCEGADDGEVSAETADAHPQYGEQGGAWYRYTGEHEATIPTMAKMELYARLVGDYELKDRRIFYFIQGEQNPPAAYVAYSDEIELIDGVYHLAGDITRMRFDPHDSQMVNVIAGHYFEISGTRGESGCYYAPVGSTVKTTAIPSQRRTNWLFPGRSIDPVRTDWVRKGIYYIDTREWDAQHEFLTITGYDAMLKTEQNYFTPPVTITGWPKTDAAVVSEICTRIGVELDTRTVLNKGYMVQIPAVSSDGKDSDTLREVLGWIGGMYGGNWCITDEGKLRLVPLVPTETVSVGTDALDLTTTPAYDALGIVHLVVSEDAEYRSPQSGGTGRAIEISCPWGTQTMADNILTAIGGYVYQPLTVTTATEANPLWELGDGVTVNGYTSVIAAMPTAFGLKYTADIEAPESEEINHEYPYQDKGTRDIERKIAQSSASLRIGIDEIESVVKGIAKPYVQGRTYNKYDVVYHNGNYYSCKVQTSSATWVASEWTAQSSGALSSIIKQTMDSITLSAVSGNNQSTVKITANGIDVDSAVVKFSNVVADSIVANSSITSPNILGGTYYNSDESYSMKLSDDIDEYGLIINHGDQEFFRIYDGDFKALSLSAKGDTFMLINEGVFTAYADPFIIKFPNGRFWEISGGGIDYFDSDGSWINSVRLIN